MLLKKALSLHDKNNIDTNYKRIFLNILHVNLVFLLPPFIIRHAERFVYLLFFSSICYTPLLFKIILEGKLNIKYNFIDKMFTFYQLLITTNDCTLYSDGLKSYFQEILIKQTVNIIKSVYFC